MLGFRRTFDIGTGTATATATASIFQYLFLTLDNIKFKGFEHFDADSVIVEDKWINLIPTWDEDVSEYNFLGITFESFECGCAATLQGSISNFKLEKFWEFCFQSKRFIFVNKEVKQLEQDIVHSRIRIIFYAKIPVA